MNSQINSDLYPWNRDLEASRDIAVKDHAAFAMILGWMERFWACHRLSAGREACERFWREQVLVKPREKWQKEQWTSAPAEIGLMIFGC